MRAERRLRMNGFTLLEVLVALSILAMSYGVILQIFGGAAQKASLSGDYRRAMIIAESKLDYVAATAGPANVADTGTVGDKFDWQVSIVPTDEYSIEGMPSRYTPVVINVDVRWENTPGQTKSVSVSTIRLERSRVGS